MNRIVTGSLLWPAVLMLLAGNLPADDAQEPSDIPVYQAEYVAHAYLLPDGTEPEAPSGLMAAYGAIYFADISSGRLYRLDAAGEDATLLSDPLIPVGALQGQNYFTQLNTDVFGRFLFSGNRGKEMQLLDGSLYSLPFNRFLFGAVLFDGEIAGLQQIGGDPASWHDAEIICITRFGGTITRPWSGIRKSIGGYRLKSTDENIYLVGYQRELNVISIDRDGTERQFTIAIPSNGYDTKGNLQLADFQPENSGTLFLLFRAPETDHLWVYQCADDGNVVQAWHMNIPQHYASWHILKMAVFTEGAAATIHLEAGRFSPELEKKLLKFSYTP